MWVELMQMNGNLRRGLMGLRLVVVAVLLLPGLAFAGGPLVLDGEFGEWRGFAPILDPGEAGRDGIDLDSLVVARAGNWLTLSFTTGREVILQSGNPLRLLLDLDGDPETGVVTGDLGVDLLWDFADRSGWIHVGGVRQNIGTEEIELTAAPAMASTRFELALLSPLPVGATVGVSLHSREQDGDQLGPEEGMQLVPSKLTLPSPMILDRKDPSHLRFMLWNCWDDHFRDEPESFARIAKAAAPDILVLVDVEHSNAHDIETVAKQWLGGPDTGEWHVRHRGEDTAIASPFPILGDWTIPGMPRAGAFLLELPEPFESPVFLLAIHPVCCNDDRLRQQQVDALLAFVREAYSPGSELGVAPETPLLIIGDTNLIGWSSQHRGYTEGAIFDQERYGPSPSQSAATFPLTDLVSRHTDGPHAYTWRDDGTEFGPARIDCVFYPGKIFGVGTHFVIDTRSMDEGRREMLGLDVTDSELASDHLPHVVDFYPLAAEEARLKELED